MYFRNPIIAIIGTILFWVICFACGETYKSIDKYMSMCDAVDVVKQDGAILQMDRMGIPHFWDESADTWEPTLIKEDSYKQINSVKLQLMFPFIPKVPFPQDFSPAFVKEYDAWVGVDKNFLDFQKLNPKLTVVKTGQRAEPQVLLGVPSNPVKFLQHPDGSLFAATGRGEFYKLNQNPLTAKPKPKLNKKDGNKKDGNKKDGNKKDDDKKDDDKKDDDKKDDDKKIAKSKTDDKQPEKPDQRIEDLFVQVGPERPIDIRDHRFVDINQSNGEIAVYRSRSIFIFKKDENGDYQLDRSAESDLEIDSSMTAWIKYQGSNVFLCLGNGKIITMDGAKLLHQNEYLPESRSAIFSASASPNGRYLAVTYRNGNVWLLDREKDDKMQKARVSNQGNLKAAVFDPDGKLIVADKTARLSWYDLDSGKQTERLSPKITGIKKFYYWGIKPLYQIFPKPGEFYKLVSHLASSRETENKPDLDLTTTTEPENPWQPFRSGLVFILVMLVLSCLVFQYTDY
jgi:hypothetical protein